MRWWQRLSIRARITIGSLLVAIVISGIAVLAIRAEVKSILTEADETLAVADLGSFQTDIMASPDEPVDDATAGLLVLIRDPSGSTEVDTMPRELHETLEHRTGANEVFTVSTHRAPYTVVGRTVETPVGTWSLWSARSSAASTLALENLERVLQLGAVVLLALFGVASWLLASAALRPVARMRRQAESLGASSPAAGSSARLPVGAAQDELAELASTLNDFLDRAQQSADREKQMVSDASHELRTPLAALRTQLELAHADFGDADALARQVIAAQGSVERLSSLATGLLALSRLETPDGSTASSSADELVNELLGSVDRARLLAVSSTVDISFETDLADPDARFGLSATDFGRLVDNLMSNAVAAADGNGQVRVILRDVSLGGGSSSGGSGGSSTLTGVRLDVIDDGPGVPASFLPVAFDRFTRPDDSRTSSTGGSGLGLALVMAIARSAGGTARLSNGHPGLVATVELPRVSSPNQ